MSDAEEEAKEAEAVLSEEPYEMNLTEALLASALQEGIIDIVMATGEAARQNDKREAWVKLNIPDHWSRNILSDPGKADQYFLLRCPLPYAQAFFLFWAEKLQTKMVSVPPGVLAYSGQEGGQ